MRLLILGGTLFVGRHLAEQALERGHSVSLFHRGRTNAGLFPEAEHLIGDRDGDLAALRAGSWDAAIDTSGYVPRVVAASSAALADRVEHLTFVSSISVYATRAAGTDESAAVGVLEDPSTEEVTGDSYGPLKALCETAAETAMPGRVLNVRPCIIVGPHDPTERFTWWVRRMARGGDVLAPGSSSAPVQVIDVRDLAAWMLDMAEARTTGVFNTADSLDMSAMLEACRAAAGGDARLVWVDDETLMAAGVEPFVDLPFWIPDGEDQGFMQTDARRAVAAGLRFRPLEATARDTLAWAREVPDGRPAESDSPLPPAPGIAPEREAELLRDAPR
jgi:2'-hydroxyisoflavone reductase